MSGAEKVLSTKCGFIAVLGAPNAGKSTLVNAIVGAKVSIVSPKVQTTRSRVRGVVIKDRSQIVFIDTPGIFSTPKRRLERAMIAAAWRGVADADILMLVMDAERGADGDVEAILRALEAEGRRNVVLVLNKIDLLDRTRLLALADSLFSRGLFTKVFMISALREDGVQDVLSYLVEIAPEGPWMFPEDEISDLPQRLLAAEITREQVFLQLHDELPYSIAVETDSWQEREDGSVRIEQTIFVLRDSQKVIVLGKGGARIKSIGAAARKELVGLLDRQVHLFLHVKVSERWTEEKGRYTAWGLDFDA